jgi:hypothetical protein
MTAPVPNLCEKLCCCQSLQPVMMPNDSPYASYQRTPAPPPPHHTPLLVHAPQLQHRSAAVNPASLSLSAITYLLKVEGFLTS